MITLPQTHPPVGPLCAPEVSSSLREPWVETAILIVLIRHDSLVHGFLCAHTPVSLF